MKLYKILTICQNYSKKYLKISKTLVVTDEGKAISIFPSSLPGAKAESNITTKWIKMVRKYVTLIRQWLEYNIYNHVTETKTPRSFRIRFYICMKEILLGTQNLLVRRLINLCYKKHDILIQLFSLNIPLDNV